MVSTTSYGGPPVGEMIQFVLHRFKTWNSNIRKRRLLSIQTGLKVFHGFLSAEHSSIYGSQEDHGKMEANHHMCYRVDQLLVLGMGDLQPLIGNPYNGYIKPYYWVDDHPLLYGNFMGVDRPVCTHWSHNLDLKPKGSIFGRPFPTDGCPVGSERING